MGKDKAIAVATDAYDMIVAPRIEDAVTSESVMLFQVERDFGKDSVIGVFAAGIVDLNQFLNTNKDMSFDTIWQIAQLAVEEYNDLTLESIKLFFKNIKLGKYGKVYGRYGGNDLLDWLRQFYNEYWQLYEDTKREENRKANEFTPHNDEHYEFTEEMQRIANRLSGNGDHSDIELETIGKERDIRLKVIKENMGLYSDQAKSPEEVEAIINNEIEIALHAEGIFH